jgi:CRP-like cAMP-binding protein
MLDERFGRGGRRLGSVERAQLGLARLLLASPDAVVLNDPWLNLEREIQTELWALVREAFANQPVLVVTNELVWIEDTDAIVVLSASGIVERGSRSGLLTSSARFRQLWDRSTGSGVVADDFEAIESLSQLSETARNRLAQQMVTEQFSADDFIYMTGDDEDALYFVVDGAVVLEDHGRRVATIRRGDHFGDIDRSSNGRRLLSARALTPTVVRRLHRLSVSAGVTGMLDRSGMEQKVFRLLTREGQCSRNDVAQIGDGALAALDELVAEGTVVAETDTDGTATYRSASSQRRSTGVGRSMVSLLDDLIAEDSSDDAGA